MKLNSTTTLLLSIGQLVLVSATRDRIGHYVAEGQQFLIEDPSVDVRIALYENPDAEPVILSRIFWFCPPEHAPDTNGDGEYDHVVSHALTYRPSNTVEGQIGQGASVSGSWTPHGYVAAWSKDGATYDETIVDYDDTTIHKLMEVDDNVASVLAWESSAAGGSNGVVAAGAAEWVTDTSDPRLVAMSKSLGMDLTGDTCREQYAKVWKETNSKKATAPDPAFVAGVILSTIGIVALVVAIAVIFSVHSRKTVPTDEKPQLKAAESSSASWRQEPV